MTPCYAHSLPGHPESEWQTLEEHSRNVAELAAKFAAPFGCAETAKLLGLVHDMGKASPVFQDYLKKANGIGYEDDDGDAITNRGHGPDHSTAGAQWLDSSINGLGRILAYASSGHHSGIPDGISSSGGTNSLKARLGKKCVINKATYDVHYNLGNIGLEARPFLTPDDGFAYAFYVRMLYSCLVDADFLDTEHFVDSERSLLRNETQKQTLRTLLDRLERHYAQIDKHSEETGSRNLEVNRVRNEVRSDCINAAGKKPGLFTLRVPTGGGKTLSAMLFALHHAIRHNLDRVIVVIPFTSIIEQTANIYREVFGSENVLEHHCNAESDSMSPLLRLATENWDAPIIVTTNVQFFESLFANRSSRCRKLHSIARSVIILDEAQGLPIELLKPCLKTLNELVARYGTTILLSTATLPVFFDESLLGEAALTHSGSLVTDIVPTWRNLQNRLKRVQVRRLPQKVTDDELLHALKDEPCVLVIVGTRRHARELYQKAKSVFPERMVRHLSAQMCGEHRADVLNEVKKSLSDGSPCFLISTQLIEAGVDIDFPCVCRELAGLDSLAQAAGRCNREGKLQAPGRFILFESDEFDAPGGFLRTAAQKGRETLGLADAQDNPLGEKSVETYFRLLYGNEQKGNQNAMDKYGVLTCLLPKKRPINLEDMFGFKFRELGKVFRLIDSNNCSVIVPYGKEGHDLCEHLRASYSPSEQRRLVRKLQRYAVSLYGERPTDHNRNLIAEKVHDCFWIMTSPELYYSPEFGVATEPQDVVLQA